MHSYIHIYRHTTSRRHTVKSCPTNLRSVRGPHGIGPNIRRTSPQKHACGPPEHGDEGCWRLHCCIIAVLPHTRMFCCAIPRHEGTSPGKAISDARGKRPRARHTLICVADMHLVCGRPTVCADGHKHAHSRHQLASCGAAPVAMRYHVSKPKPELMAGNSRRLTLLRCLYSTQTQHRQIRRR